MKSEFRSESFKRKFSRIVFVLNMIIGCSKKNTVNYPKKAFPLANKETQIKINLGSALIGLRTSGPWREYKANMNMGEGLGRDSKDVEI